jgi:hypothetical protein
MTIKLARRVPRPGSQARGYVIQSSPRLCLRSGSSGRAKRDSEYAEVVLCSPFWDLVRSVLEAKTQSPCMSELQGSTRLHRRNRNLHNLYSVALFWIDENQIARLECKFQAGIAHIPTFSL